jgi:hypothetical protein
MCINNQLKTLAVLSLYSVPDQILQERSSDTLLVCKYGGDLSLAVIEVKKIVGVVAMVPFTQENREASFFVVERIGLDLEFVEDALDDDDR